MGIVRRAARVSATTAVMAGTANAVSRKQQQKWEAKDAQAQAAQQQATAPAQSDTAAQLEELAELKNKGILTEEEFQAKKKQILGI